jgi:predicted nucleic acid-binding protein
MDMLIGAHAVAVNATLVTDDGAFNHFKEWITTENWVNE